MAFGEPEANKPAIASTADEMIPLLLVFLLDVGALVLLAVAVFFGLAEAFAFGEAFAADLVRDEADLEVDDFEPVVLDFAEVDAFEPPLFFAAADLDVAALFAEDDFIFEPADLDEVDFDPDDLDEPDFELEDFFVVGMFSNSSGVHKFRDIRPSFSNRHTNGNPRRLSGG